MIFALSEIKSNSAKSRLNIDNGLINYVFTDFLLHIDSITIDGELNDKLSYKELETFMDSLPTKIFDKVFEEYQLMVDSLELKYEFTCDKCNSKQDKIYSNIPNFLWV